MTKEQIEKKALEYSQLRHYSEEELFHSITSPEEVIRLAFIAGAHSSDEDIKELADDCRARLNNYENQLCEARDDAKNWRDEYEHAKKNSDYFYGIFCKTYDEMRSYMGPIRGFFWDVKVGGFKSAIRDLFRKDD